MPQNAPSAIQHDQSGNASSAGIRKKKPPLLTAGSAPKSFTHTEAISALMLNRWPHLVRKTALYATPNPAATKKTPNISAPAAGFHFTQAESASASSASIRIQTHAPTKRAPPMRAFAAIQSHPSR